MTFGTFQKSTLGVAGVTALGIGLAILAAPHAFYASYGITLGADVNLLSELRAPAAGLAVLGALMLMGIWREAWRDVSIVAAFTVFLAFPAGRVVGLIVDGIPSGSVLAALGLELAIAALCLAAFGRRSQTGKQHAAGPA
ncbi:DUF4345 domain-containing protein [Rhodobacteraceae bacterium N5(2021)]|uniref:DUF4345 domain-containing protein n=1 Tax=Gymnodinialimonas phycosphaerae TaxID=2841589 RepID=A0A975TWF0_9RHOB|nr:DUF4345 domain-containing protein [Gymnodinialimonas phycosphaerae]MBY4891927.1 DUF4345 domain-containing protein [Gymnodinialimonas phycosphaerae]